MSDLSSILAVMAETAGPYFHGPALFVVAAVWALKATCGYGLFRVVRARRRRALASETQDTRLPL